MWEDGWGSNSSSLDEKDDRFENKNYYMGILGLIVSVLLLIGLIQGFYKYKGIDVTFGIKDMSSPYYQFGVSFIEYIDEEGNSAEELSIFLIFFSLQAMFYKI